jgi:hypothetical protein
MYFNQYVGSRKHRNRLPAPAAKKYKLHRGRLMSNCWLSAASTNHLRRLSLMTRNSTMPSAHMKIQIQMLQPASDYERHLF